MGFKAQARQHWLVVLVYYMIDDKIILKKKGS